MRGGRQRARMEDSADCTVLCTCNHAVPVHQEQLSWCAALEEVVVDAHMGAAQDEEADRVPAVAPGGSTAINNTGGDDTALVGERCDARVPLASTTSFAGASRKSSSTTELLLPVLLLSLSLSLSSP